MKKTKLSPTNVIQMLRRDYQLYLLLLPAVVYLFIFNYIPMYGVQIAFRNFVATNGITGSEWVGLLYFKEFFSSYFWERIILNTIILNLYHLIFSFPIPIILAIMLNQVASKKFKSTVQTIIYAPHFISVVVLAGIIFVFLSPDSGMVNHLITVLGGKPIYFMNESSWFRTIYIGSGIWQSSGWASIIYLAALSGVDVQLYESATIDGANKFHKIFYIDIPSILPVVIMMLILNSGTMLSSEFQKTFLLQTPGNMATSDTVGVYVYKIGLLQGQFSYTAAIGLMLNVTNLIILFIVNKISKKTGNTSLW